MKKIVLALLLLITSVGMAQAQFTLGLKAGVSSSNVDIKDPKNTLQQFKSTDAITGYHAGAFMRIKAAGILLQPEAILSSTGGKVEVTDGGITTSEQFKFNRLDVPVLLGVSLFNVARIQAGPVASVLVSGKFKDQRLQDYMNKYDLGWQAGIGFDIGNITTDLRYERVNREFTGTPDNGSFGVGNQQLILSLGFKIIGK